MGGKWGGVIERARGGIGEGEWDWSEMGMEQWNMEWERRRGVEFKRREVGKEKRAWEELESVEKLGLELKETKNKIK